ncbi:MAG: hypothetical protein WBN40_00470 [Pseudomonadales bacterium]
MYNFIHIESSGIGHGSYPIEIGVALADGRRHCTLICPPMEWLHWEESDKRSSTLSREKLLVNGRSVLEVALSLNEWLGDAVVYSDAWGNDVCWLAELYRQAGVRQRFTLETVSVLVARCDELVWQVAKSEADETLCRRRWRASNRAAVLQNAAAKALSAGTRIQAVF